MVALVERGGTARVFHVGDADKATVAKLLRDNVHPETRLHTDEAHIYKTVGKEFAAHESVKHSDEEYVRGDVTTNSVEGFFGVFKRGMRGTYQHCGEKYLARYVTEFELRHNTRTKLGFNANDRATLAIKVSGASAPSRFQLDAVANGPGSSSSRRDLGWPLAMASSVVVR